MRSTRAPQLVAFAAVLTLAGAGLAVPTADAAARGIAVAPFTKDAGTGGASFDVAQALATTLDSSSGLRVVPPGELGPNARARHDPEAVDIRRWASHNDVDNVVIGHREGLDVSVELRSGHSGGALAEYRMQPATPEDVPGAVRQLARLILADLGQSAVGLDEDLPPVSAPADATPDAAPTVDAPDAPRDDEGGSLAFLPGPQRNDPIAINSDELEVLPEAGGRRLVFSRNVEVLQGDVTLNANRLEAIYPQGASQPDTLHASGDVRVHQGDRRASCDEATYERAANTIVCRGRAEVTQGCDRVRGEEIEFDLLRERVRVSGAASVVIRSEPESADGAACAGEQP